MTKVFYGNQFVGSLNVNGKKYTKWQRLCRKSAKLYKRSVLAAGILTAIGYAYVGGTMTKLAQADTKIVYMQSTSTPAVMVRIAKCESSSSQYKDGQVQIHVNSNGSVDEGEYMINLQTWGPTATKLGYDLTKQADNVAFAMFLYATQGTSPWVDSQHCWK